MKRLAACSILLLLQTLPAEATPPSPAWQSCVDMKGVATSQDELVCYRQLAGTTASDVNKKPLMTSRPRGLLNEWQPANDLLNVYKLNYVLVFSRTSKPNELPGSPNPLNQVTTATALDERDLKFQFSIKHDLTDHERYGSLWFAYTQSSFWQLYDASHSRPFRENNYEPELIYSMRPNELFTDFDLFPAIFNIGLVHQSNGQSNPRSRSWNRAYIQPGIERSYGNGRRIVLLARLWHRIQEDAASDDNPDITDYLGYGDLEIRYSLDGKWEATAIARSRSFELNLAAPWDSIRLLTLAAPGEHNTNIHIQYFTGYGESLIDYNHRQSRWGVGMSFPFD